jgi:hypothetical protein
MDKKIIDLYGLPYLFVIFLALGMEKMLQKMGWSIIIIGLIEEIMETQHYNIII